MSQVTFSWQRTTRTRRRLPKEVILIPAPTTASVAMNQVCRGSSFQNLELLLLVPTAELEVLQGRVGTHSNGG